MTLLQKSNKSNKGGKLKKENSVGEFEELKN